MIATPNTKKPFENTIAQNIHENGCNEELNNFENSLALENLLPFYYLAPVMAKCSPICDVLDATRCLSDDTSSRPEWQMIMAVGHMELLLPQYRFIYKSLISSAGGGDREILL